MGGSGTMLLTELTMGMAPGEAHLVSWGRWGATAGGMRLEPYLPARSKWVDIRPTKNQLSLQYPGVCIGK